MSTVKNNSFNQSLFSPENRTIAELCRIKADHIYIYFQNNDVFTRFVCRAKDENLRCGAQNLNYTDLLALQLDGSAVYCNTISRIAFGSGEGISGGIVRIDFERFISGDPDYLYHKLR